MIKSLKVFSTFLGYEIAELRHISARLKNEDTRKDYYYSYKKTKPNGKFRIIAPSCNELKDIQNKLLNRIFIHVNFPFYITGGVAKRSGVLNAKIHSGKKYHLQTDLTSFFDFVTSEEVYNSLLELGFSYDVAKLLTELTTYKGHLPQGAPTSPFLANLVGLTIDQLFLEYCEKNGVSYSRYIDDLTFSSHTDFKSDVSALLEKINQLGFIFNHKKTWYKTGVVQITGANSGCTGLTGTNKQIDNLFNRKTSRPSQRGILAHLEHINSVNKNFNLKKYKQEFPELSFPSRIFPYMNFKKANVSDADGSDKMFEYFEDALTPVPVLL